MNNLSTFHLMIGLRSLYAGVLGLCIITNRIDLAVEFAIPFAGTMLFFYLGRDDPEYYLVDAGFSALFTTAMLFSYFDLWPSTFSMTSPDKLFHLLAGFCLAQLAYVFYRHHIHNRIWLVATIILAALAIGAVWEIFEWTISILPQGLSIPSTGYQDSIQDLIADAIGGCLAGLCLWNKNR